MSKPSKDANKAMQSGSGARDGQYSKSLQRGLEILRCFTAEHPVLGISELADQLHGIRSTAHRYATTLVALDYLEQDRSRKYRLGARAADVGLTVISCMPILEHAWPVLQKLRLQTNYTVALGIIDGDEVLYLASLRGSRQGQHAVDLEVNVGSRAPLHCTAIGKAMLARLPDAQQNTLIAQMKLSKHAPNTITSKKALRVALGEISSEGLLADYKRRKPEAQQARIASAIAAQLAVDDEESTPGIQAIAAPIISTQREVRGAIGLLAPRSVSTLDQLRSEHGATLLEEVKALAVSLDLLNAVTLS
jgi:DNA-binding IclR family transcriptional regulator